MKSFGVSVVSRIMRREKSSRRMRRMRTRGYWPGWLWWVMGAGVDAEVRRRYYDMLKRLAAVFASGIEKHRFKKIADPFYLAAALDSAIDASLLLWHDAPERFSFPEDPDTILDIFFKGLLET